MVKFEMVINHIEVLSEYLDRYQDGFSLRFNVNFHHYISRFSHRLFKLLEDGLVPFCFSVISRFDCELYSLSGFYELVACLCYQLSQVGFEWIITSQYFFHYRRSNVDEVVCTLVQFRVVPCFHKFLDGSCRQSSILVSSHSERERVSLLYCSLLRCSRQIREKPTGKSEKTGNQCFTGPVNKAVACDYAAYKAAKARSNNRYGLLKPARPHLRLAPKGSKVGKVSRLARNRSSYLKGVA